MHSSISGGILTFIATVILCVYAYITLRDTINRIQHSVTSSFEIVDPIPPLKEFKDTILSTNFSIVLPTNSKESVGNCSDYLLIIGYFKTPDSPIEWLGYSIFA